MSPGKAKKMTIGEKVLVKRRTRRMECAREHMQRFKEEGVSHVKTRPKDDNSKVEATGEPCFLPRTLFSML